MNRKLAIAITNFRFATFGLVFEFTFMAAFESGSLISALFREYLFWFKYALGNQRKFPHAGHPKSCCLLYTKLIHSSLNGKFCWQLKRSLLTCSVARAT